jgi:type II secretion system (T2SS) protein G
MIPTAAEPKPPRPQASWPLLLLACLSIIPGAGFVCGSLAVTWGLLADLPRAKLAIVIGATGALLQLGVFVAILATKGPESFQMGGLLSYATRQDLRTVVEALEAYREDKAAYPEALEELEDGSLRVNVMDMSAGFSTKPEPYQYQRSADGEHYDLFAVGPDGEPETEDDIRPVLPERLRARAGYRPRKD